MAKRLTKEELEHDALLDSYEKVQAFYYANRSTVIGSSIAIILLVGLGLGYYFYSQSQEREAQQLMTTAEEYFMRGQYELALEGSEAEFTLGFTQIIDNYRRTRTANLARYYAAVSEYNLGNTEQALEYMKNFSPPGGILGVGPISFQAVLLSELGRHSEAAQTYVKAAEWNEDDSSTPYNLLEAARAYHEAGNRESAETYANRVINEFPNSPHFQEAEKLRGLLIASDMNR